MTHGSLFSGIGGFDLAAQWMGWDNIFQVEKDSFCRAVLTKNFPNTNKYEDIKTFDGSKYSGAIDVVTGGFPCQPFSTAGKRKGTDDDRYLWPEMLRVIREIQPRYVVGENVRGITNWDEGVVFDSVQSDLEVEGYEVLPFLLPACGVGAPHRRDRVWFIAYSKSNRNRRGLPKVEAKNDKIEESKECWKSDTKSCDNGDQWINSNPNCNERCERRLYSSGSETSERYTCTRDTCNGWHWKDFPTQPGICRRDDGVPYRVDRIKSLGNAIVPQVAFEIFKAIELTYEKVFHLQKNSGDSR